MALPLRLLWKLQIETRQKLALAAVFSFAIVIIVFAIVRIVEINSMLKHVDPIWLALWSMIEASVGKQLILTFEKYTQDWQLNIIFYIAVVVACLPSFHVLLTSRSSSAFNRRNPSNSRLRQQENTSRLSDAVPSVRSLRDTSQDVA
ncbi:hypothetical protein MMC29_007577 [Sticta canariensis]|nr:hypothetical protein [Sticta canariensis]